MLQKDDLTDRILAQMDDDAADRLIVQKHQQRKAWFFGLPVSNDPWTRVIAGLVLLAIAPYIVWMAVLVGNDIVKWWNTPIVEVKF